jgi:hypothetical protein
MKNLSPQQKSAMTVFARKNTLEEFLIKYNEVSTKKELTSYFNIIQGIEELLKLQAKKENKALSFAEKAVHGTEFKKALETKTLTQLKTELFHYEASEEEVAAAYEKVDPKVMAKKSKLPSTTTGLPSKEEKVKEIKTPKEKPLKISKEKIEKVPKVVKEKVSKVIELTPSMQKVIDNDELSKSAKFIELNKKGLSVSQITKVMDTHYSFVQSVITKYNANVIDATN